MPFSYSRFCKFIAKLSILLKEIEEDEEKKEEGRRDGKNVAYVRILCLPRDFFLTPNKEAGVFAKLLRI
jgi:hypothetical protein